MFRNQGADNPYRAAVFTSPLDPLEPKVSGVGLNHDPDGGFYTVPSQYDTRWDDEAYQFRATDELPLMRQSPYDGRHGFILHATCHSFLQGFFYPKMVPVARLLEVCKSFPFQNLGLSWGHDYGGMVSIDQEYQYPWEDQYHDPEQLEPTHQPADPWNVPELKELLQRAQLGFLIKQPTNSTKLTRTGCAGLSNFFTGLPFEILEHIVTYLPTDEVKTLARTSRGLAMVIPSELGQSFWASRFRKSFELDFIFETQEHRDRLDWRALYFGVMKVMLYSSGLQNRKRIWGLIRSPLSGLLCIRCSGNPALPLRDANKARLRWREVCGNLQPLVQRIGASKFAAGCKRFYAQRAFIPTSLCRVIVSTISIANATYITGARLIPKEGPEACLGYTAERNQSFPNTVDQFMDATGVQGFILAVGSRGIQALQFITCAGQLSQWFGCPDGLPRTRRLATSESIAALEAGFDVRVASF